MTVRISGTNRTLNFVAWTGPEAGLLAAVGEFGTVCISPDGLTWAPAHTGTTEYLSAVAWTGEKFVVVGSGGTVLVSPDGAAWTIGSTGLSIPLYSVIWAGTQLVATGGGGAILTSPDGVHWTARNSGTKNALSSVIWADRQLVAVGVGGTILTSPDGINWTGRASGTTRNLHSVAWTGSAGSPQAGDQFVAVGGWPEGGGTVHISPDGIRWTSGIPQTLDWLYSVAWTGGQFVAVGKNGAVLVSPDGNSWTPRTSGITNTLYAVTCAGPLLVAVGQGGAIFTMPDDSPAVASRQSALQNGMLLRVTPGELFFTPPLSLRNQKMTATIHALSGRKEVISQTAYTWAAGEFHLPIKSLARGAYRFELKGDEERFTRTFSVTK